MNNYAASIEFHTLSIPCPTNLSLRKSTAPDLYTLTWQPVVVDNTNIIQISGYSIYLDGTLVHQILDAKGILLVDTIQRHYYFKIQF